MTGIVYGRLMARGWGAVQGFDGLVLDPAGEAVAVDLLEAEALAAHWDRPGVFEGADYRRAVTKVITPDGPVAAFIYVLAGTGQILLSGVCAAHNRGDCPVSDPSGLTHDDVRRLGLGLPSATEQAHFGKADFRVGGKVFATLPAPDHAVVKLVPEQQDMLVSAEPAVFSPVAGAWGLKGWTRLRLADCDTATLASALNMAWHNVAPRRLWRDLP
jgi:hypothetical protein